MLSCGSIFHFLKLKLLLYETVVVCAAHTSHCMDVVSIPLLVIGSGTGVSGCQMYVVELACQMYVVKLACQMYVMKLACQMSVVELACQMYVVELACQMYVVELACQMYVMEGILLIPLGVLPSSTAKAADGFIGL